MNHDASFISSSNYICIVITNILYLYSNNYLLLFVLRQLKCYPWFYSLEIHPVGVECLHLSDLPMICGVWAITALTRHIILKGAACRFLSQRWDTVSIKNKKKKKRKVRNMASPDTHTKQKAVTCSHLQSTLCGSGWGNGFAVIGGGRNPPWIRLGECYWSAQQVTQMHGYKRKS